MVGGGAEPKNLSMLSARFPRSQEGGLTVFISNRAPHNDETNATLRIAAAELEPILSATLQADALEKLKADFTAMIIHDLRAPLTAIMSAAAIVEDGLVGPVNDEQKRRSEPDSFGSHQRFSRSLQDRSRAPRSHPRRHRPRNDRSDQSRRLRRAFAREEDRPIAPPRRGRLQRAGGPHAARTGIR